MNKITNGKITGIIPPIITPLNEDGTLDLEGLTRVIEYDIAGGCSGIFVMGSTGEAMRVSRQTWRDTINNACRIAGDRVHVFCGVIDSSTERVIENIKTAEQFGAKYVVSTVPFYIQNCCQDEMIRHYEKIASSTALNVVVYNIPSNVGTKIEPETVARLAQIENIKAYKDSTADWENFQRCLFLLKDADISIFNGAEELCAAAMLFGANGCVPGLGCIFPKVFVDMYNAAQEGNIELAFQLQKQVWLVRKALFAGQSWLSAMKYLGKYTGLSSTDYASFPIEPLTTNQKNMINQYVKESGLL